MVELSWREHPGKHVPSGAITPPVGRPNPRALDCQIQRTPRRQIQRVVEVQSGPEEVIQPDVRVSFRRRRRQRRHGSDGLDVLLLVNDVLRFHPDATDVDIATHQRRRVPADVEHIADAVGADVEDCVAPHGARRVVRTAALRRRHRRQEGLAARQGAAPLLEDAVDEHVAVFWVDLPEPALAWLVLPTRHLLEALVQRQVVTYRVLKEER